MNEKEAYIVNAMMVSFKKSSPTAINTMIFEEQLEKQIGLPVTCEIVTSKNYFGILVRVFDFANNSIRRYAKDYTLES